MSFLSRKSRALQDTANTEKFSGLVTPPREHEEKLASHGGSLRKRLSSFTLLGTPKRHASSRQSSQKGGAVGYVRQGSAFPAGRSRSPSPEPSLEIRRPSGLGRRVSVMLPEQVEVLDISYRGRHPMNRQLSVSAPDLSLPLFKWEEVPSVVENASESGLERGSSELGYLRPGSSRCPSPSPSVRREPLSFDFSRIPAELLKSVFTESSKRDLASLSLVCRAFVWPARAALYEHLNLQDVRDPHRVEKCVAWLASRREIAAIVRSFSCPLAPDMGPNSLFTPAATITFAIALTNMVQLQSLTLPRFTPYLLLHTTFQLKRLSLTCQSMSLDECRDLFSWIPHQPALTSLCFPNLVMDAASRPSSAETPCNPAPGISQPPEASPLAIFLTIPSDALTKLSQFHGPSSLATMLIPGRPLQSLAITIHTTLYDGLRPSALMASVARSTSPITSLSVIASSQRKVDARTLERVLMSAGAELGQCLQALEIEWILEDELLYKQILSVLPRFAALHTLRLRRRLPPPPPRSPPPSFPLPTTSLSTPPPSPSSFFANSKVFAWTPPDSPNASYRLSTGSQHISLDVPLPRAHERSHLASWSKHCRTLKNVVFLSGAEWRIGLNPGEAPGASHFTYLGISKT